MSSLSADYAYDSDEPARDPLGLAPEPVEVRRNGGLAALVGAVASILAIAYLARAADGGSVLDWALAAVLGVLGVGYLRAFVDARTPLLVADDQGVRVRLGRTWTGLPWSAIEEVEHQPRQGLRHDGRLVLVATDTEGLLEGLDSSGRRQARWAERLHGSAFALPLALSTRVVGSDGDLTAALARLADDPAKIVEVVEVPEVEVEPEVAVAPEVEVEVALEPEFEAEAEPEPDDVPERHFPDPRPSVARAIGYFAARLPQGPAAEPTVETPSQPTTAPLVASATPSPLRDPVTATRAEVQYDGRFDLQGAAALAADPADHETSTELPEARELRRRGSVDLVEETVVWNDRVSPIARPGDPVTPLVIDDYSVEPAADPVIGPELAAARTRLGLSIDQLAERTRIRPHVIESIEVDDFDPCGGDFYARGHLRTLARVLGIDAAPLLADYAERYADVPINARRVFEAELSTGSDGPIRSTRGGVNWSVLVAAVMAVVLCWSVARLIMDSPVDLGSKAVLNGSPTQTQLADPVPVVLDAADGGARVVVRDGAGEMVFNGNLTYGQTKRVKAAPPVRIQSSDGALKVTVDGAKRGALGSQGQPAQNTFAAAGR